MTPVSGATDPASSVQDGGDIIVTGYRASLNSAVDLKRESVSAVDAIVAEDIAAFPDQNLAESLQRIPGIAITRDGGEGREVTVRGLGAGYTLVRLNGMQTNATSSSNDGANSSRAFDFDLFASDLFNSIVVHKTPEAQLDEGTLGATIDLNTGNPLSYDDGFTFVGSAKAQYNDLNDKAGPRLAGLLAYKDPSGDWAASVSAAWSHYKTAEFGNDTVRWQQARFNSVEGTPCFGGDGGYVSSAPCDEAALAFHPRIPRYDDVYHERDRLGVTASFQARPFENTEINLNGLYARYNQNREGNVAEVLFRSNERGIDIVDYTLDPDSGDMIAGTFDNAWVRVEHAYRESFNRFHQVSGDIKQTFSDSFSMKLFGGFSRSRTYTPDDLDMIFDDRDATSYSYDYANRNAPRITFNDDITRPEAFQFSEFRDRRTRIVNKFRTIALDADWKATDALTITGGGFYRRYDFDIDSATRDSTYCAAFACAPGQYGAPVSDAISSIYDLPDLGGAPAGTSPSYVLPDIAAAADLVDLYGRSFKPDIGGIRSVREEDSGGYFQFNVRSTMFGIDYSANAGVRYAHTRQSSTGINNDQTITVVRSYDDWLPAVNIALYPSQDVVVRGAIAKVLTRPNLGDLTPGGNVDGFNWGVSFGNPYVDPTRATTYDLGLEWYFHRGAVASVGLFKKSIESFPLAGTRTGTYASTGLPLSLILPSAPAYGNPEQQPWTIDSVENGPGASIKGFEVGLQTPLFFLPAPFDNFGIVANATYVDSSVSYKVNTPAVDATPPATPENPNASFPQYVPGVVTGTLIGLSPWSYNFTLYYEDDRFSIRGSVAYRDAYISGTGGNANIFDGYNSRLNVDASASYDLTDNITLTLEGLNLTDEREGRYTDQARNRPFFYVHTGRVVLAGARFKF
ncbi:MAG TPA: TonB-dependent receptor [Sphingomonas sp.]|nr:TonB-dependent receptor [Sphingomonas sp.]